MARTLDAVVAEMDDATPTTRGHVRRDQPRFADGRPRQQRRHPQPDPARLRRTMTRPPDATTAPVARVRRGAPGGGRRRLSGRAEADRGHDPHRRARERRGAPGRRADEGRRSSTCPCRPRRRQAGARQHPRAAAGVEGSRRRRRRRCRVPAAARLGAARRRRRADPGARRRRRVAVVGAARGGRASHGRRRDARRQRAALRGDVLPRPRRRRGSTTFKSGWGAIGDSIVVVGGDGLWNCHVHTNDIGAAIEARSTSAVGPRRSG